MTLKAMTISKWGCWAGTEAGFRFSLQYLIFSDEHIHDQ